MSAYVLGVNPTELERLRFQHEVWGPMTRAFLERLRVAAGARVLDAGCGPGFVTADLRERVGERGEVTALDESPVWIAHVRETARARGWKNVRAVEGRLEDANFPESSFDLIFLRWVLSFPPNPGAIVSQLSRALVPGGVLAIEDYNHEGISLFPESEGFRAVVRATRALYASRGGDAWVAARCPRLFREAGLELLEMTPTVKCGNPSAPVFQWAHLFFPPFSETMAAAGVMTEAERARFLEEWEARRADPNAIFFSPIVVDAAARKPKNARG
jgi:SAM-dependent methyltransferase